ncbi:MAG TPA: serine/threonine-protein kinase [Micromonospora sp.]
MRTLNGRYQLDQRIGVGGMSEVWRGHDPVLDRPVAVKLIAPGHPERTATLDRMRTEARAAARLVHPNVASVHDFGLATRPPGQQVPYIVMELVEGETLAAHLHGGALDWHIAVRVCAEVAAALAAAHGQGIVHRDVKPANVMLTPSGAKVLDFGIATSVGERDAEDGTVLGTPAFAAPERWDGEVSTPASDVYALGVLLHLCLAGRLPWPVEPGRRRPRHLAPEPLPPIDGLPAEVAELCRNALSRHPADRPTSLVAALLLAEAVDARVYVPLTGLPAPRTRTARVSPWNEQAANAPTDVAAQMPGHTR